MIRLEGTSKRYGDTIALSELTLEVEKGEFVTLLGPSGSGKTTLLNLIAGMIAPSSGRIVLDGRDVTNVPARERGLGMVFQDYALMPHMTVFENIAFPLQVRKLDTASVRERVRRVLELVQLPHAEQRKPRELSGGQQQRVALARALVYEPAIVLMDEPFGALDKKLREQMQLELKIIHRKLQVTILFVTHDQEEALAMSDRIVLLESGRIMQIGTPNELYFQPANAFSAEFLGHSNTIDVFIERGLSDTNIITEGGQRFVARLQGEVESVPGSKAKAMVRPESVRIVRNTGTHTYENTITGRLTATTSLGGILRYYVEIRDGERIETLIAQELNRERRGDLAIGDPITLAWPAQDMHVLLS